MTPKQKKLLATARVFFQKKGFKAVTIEEICKKANVSKVTFYKHYKNKDDLALVLIQIIYEEAISEGTKLLSSSKPHRTRLLELLEWKVKMLEIFTPPMLRDLKYMDPSLMAFIQSKSKDSLQIFRDFIINGQEEGVFRKDINIPFIIHIITTLSNVFFKEDLESYFDSYEKFTCEFLDFLFYGITRRDISK